MCSLPGQNGQPSGPRGVPTSPRNASGLAARPAVIATQPPLSGSWRSSPGALGSAGGGRVRLMGPQPRASGGRTPVKYPGLRSMRGRRGRRAGLAPYRCCGAACGAEYSTAVLGGVDSPRTGSARCGIMVGGPGTVRDRQSLEAVLKILVTVKRVPDTAADKRLDPADKTLDRESVETILNPVDEYAVEEALRLKEQHGGEVVVLCMGPASALATVRKALSMGPDAAVHVHDDALHGSCALNTATVLQAAIRQVEPDIVLCGSESTDARTSLVPSALAEYLGWPGLTGAKKLEVDGSTIRVHRETENGYDVLEAEGPAVVSVVKGINEPRYPSFKGIMAAKSKPVTDYTLADLGIDPGEVGAAGGTTEVVDFAPRPPRQAGQQVKDSGDGSAAVELAEFLAGHKFI